MNLMRLAERQTATSNSFLRLAERIRPISRQHTDYAETAATAVRRQSSDIVINIFVWC